MGVPKDQLDAVKAISPQEIKAAQQRAQQMGRPQPVYDPSGNMIALVDGQGNVVHVGDTPIQSPTNDYTQVAARREQASIDKAKADAEAAATQSNRLTNINDAANLAQAEREQAAASAAGLSIWVNGVQLTPVLNPDGSLKKDGSGQIVYAFGQYGSSGKNAKGATQSYTLQQMPAGFDRPSTPNSVWDALNLGATPYGLDGQIHSFDTFLVAGPGIAPGFGNYASDTSGAIIGPDDQHVTMGLSPYNNRQDLRAGVNNNGYTPHGFSMMTIGEGLQAMQQMANDDPNTYNNIINLLKHAGYDSSSSMTGGKALEGGVFTTEAAMALAHAMKDASMQAAFEMQNGQPPATSLVDFLQQKVKARADAAAAAYEPMRRDYTDPADVASAARSAAQDLIGRNLSAQEEAAFESAFHQKQVTQYNAADAAAQAQAVASAQGASAPGANLTMPSASGEAQQYLMGNQFGVDRAKYLSMQYLQGILNDAGVK